MHFYFFLPISYRDILLCSDSLFLFALGIESQYRVFGVSMDFVRVFISDIFLVSLFDITGPIPQRRVCVCPWTMCQHSNFRFCREWE